MFRKILVANRGEIALRILRTCREMNIDTVAVYSETDRDSLHVQLSGQAVCIGPASADRSYLNADAILTAAIATGCEAIHPGYGFLSENADFADKCKECGIAFIGPGGDIIRAMGDKATARESVMAAGIPVVPGSDGIVKDAKSAAELAEKIGYPVLLKATAGGGGRGMRRIFSAEEMDALFSEASAEAKACFSNGDLYLEKLILNPRHIEVQILADSHGNVCHLGGRDCSIQRRNQKLIEEAPFLPRPPGIREKLCQAAAQAAKAVGYVNAGTVEFIVSGDEFYFIEMNTRIQVEHPVTELITGIDLVREQIKIAFGLPLSTDKVRFDGHAIECRINAEDPFSDFMPCPGKVEFMHLPGGNGVRVDSALYTGYNFPPYYDSLAAKVIVHAPTRMDAIRKMRRALEELVIEGFSTTQALCHQIMYNPVYVRGNADTSFLDTHLESLISPIKGAREDSN